MYVLVEKEGKLSLNYSNYFSHPFFIWSTDQNICSDPSLEMLHEGESVYLQRKLLCHLQFCFHISCVNS